MKTLGRSLLILSLFLIDPLPARAISINLAGSGTSLNALGTCYFEADANEGGATAITLGSSTLSFYVSWEPPSGDSSVSWCGFLFPELKVTGYNLVFRDGPDWAELDTGFTLGQPSTRTVNLREHTLLTYSNGAEDLLLWFNFAADLNLNFDGSTLTGGGTWRYGSQFETGEFPLPKAVPDTSNTFVILGISLLALVGLRRLTYRDSIRTA